MKQKFSMSSEPFAQSIMSGSTPRLSASAASSARQAASGYKLRAVPSQQRSASSTPGLGGYGLSLALSFINSPFGCSPGT